MKGLFITFEGTEGSGKTTIIEHLYQQLIKEGYAVMKTREPGGSLISEQIRQVILDVNNKEMDALTEALLYAASRRQHLKEVIIPNLEKGYIVLCDRYVDSSLAYQGYARKIGIPKVYQINKFATDGKMPDLTFYIDVAPKIGLQRIKNNQRNQNRLDLEELSFHERVYKGYQKTAKMFFDRYRIIAGNRPIEAVIQDVMEEMTVFLRNHHEL
ncbi:MAG: dTMP kinase [Bacilli bacterium]|jgi:dTMP kinase|nr:dTMP kinase [Bacilli bacterium]MDY0064370.1 dTMP kinase [Bacilli bacterium]